MLSDAPAEHKTFLLAGGFSVFAGVFSGVPLYFGIRGWSKLFERPMDETGYLVGGALLIGIGMLVYFGRKIGVQPELVVKLTCFNLIY